MNEAKRNERRLDRVVRQERQNGITLDEAHEVFSRYFEQSQAAPTVATEMAVEYKTVCNILGGKIWPQARQQWMDRVFP